LWPPRFPDLNHCDFYWCQKLKTVAYANNANDLEALKHNICAAVYNILQHELQGVSQNLFKEFRHVSQQRVDILFICMMLNTILITTI
jgi:hypothetical protein